MKRTFIFILLFTGISLHAENLSLENYRNIVDNDPDQYKVYAKIGILYARLNDRTNAEINLRKAVKIKRDYAKGYYNLGHLKLAEGRYNEAAELFITAVTLDTNHTASYVNLGNIYNIRNDYPNADYYYRKPYFCQPDPC